LAEGEDRTEAATARRRSDARKKGQVAKSTELSSVAVLFGLLLVVHNTMQGAGKLVHSQLETTLLNLNNLNFTTERLWQDGTFAILTFLRVLAPIVLVAMVIGVVVNVIQTGGILWAIESVQPNFQKLNPLTGVKNLFSARSLVELFKNCYKIGIVGWLAWLTIRNSFPNLMGLWRMESSMAMATVGELIYQMALRIVGTMLILAMLDYAYQRYRHEKELRMTKQEVKQEFKQNEFDPQIRSRIRAKQREMSKKRMMDAVPSADVIITNPTHYAIALQYNPDMMVAPVVVAKGVDLLAQRIREIAIDSDVPIVENRPLARALYSQVEIGQEIPAEMYEAVAEVLAFVYEVNLRRRERMRLGIA
jgi:flagellar biosynthetic protein FlhB